MNHSRGIRANKNKLPFRAIEMTTCPCTDGRASRHGSGFNIIGLYTRCNAIWLMRRLRVTRHKPDVDRVGPLHAIESRRYSGLHIYIYIYIYIYIAVAAEIMSSAGLLLMR